jgi:hypothetical protein
MVTAIAAWQMDVTGGASTIAATHADARSEAAGSRRRRPGCGDGEVGGQAPCEQGL